MRNKLNIIIFNNYKFKYKKEFKKILKIFCKEFNFKERVSVDLLITNNEEIRKINKEYRNIDDFTDVLSFPFDNFINHKILKYQPLGEIILSQEKLSSQAKEFGHSELREFCFIFTHALVHLNNMDHKKNKEEEIEFNSHVNNIMKEVGIKRI